MRDQRLALRHLIGVDLLVGRDDDAELPDRRGRIGPLTVGRHTHDLRLWLGRGGQVVRRVHDRQSATGHEPESIVPAARGSPIAEQTRRLEAAATARFLSARAAALR